MAASAVAACRALDAAATLTDVKLALAQAASVRAAAGDEACRELALLLTHRVARDWLPLLNAHETRTLWAPFVRAALPASLDMVCETLADCSTPEEGRVVCDAVVAVLDEAAMERCIIAGGGGVIRALCSVPDRASNAAGALCPTSLDARSFFAAAARVALGLAGAHPAEAAALCSRVVVFGHAAVVAHALVGAAPEVAARCLQLCNAHVYGRVLPLCLAGAHSVAHFGALAGPCASADETARHVLENVMLVTRVEPRAEMLVRFHCGRDGGSVERVARSVAGVWSDGQFIRRADVALQLQCSRAIALFCDVRPSLRAELLPLVLAGVQQRLGIAELRRLAMAVAECCAKGSQVPLSFGEPDLEQLLRFDATVAPPPVSHATAPVSVPASVVVAADDDPDAVVDFGGGDDGSDSDSLSSYEMDAEDDADVPAGPAYLRDCLAALRERDGTRQEAALRAVLILLPARPLDLADVALPLARTILYMGDEHGIANFAQLRLDALCALALHSVAVVEWLGAQLCDANYSIQQRMDMLHCAHAAAQTLSGRLPSTAAAASAPVVLIEPAAESTDGKTRRWGSALRPASESVSSAASRQRFFDNAPSFFWPFVTGLDNARLDALVVARLLLHLGNVVAWMAASEPKRRMLDALARGVWGRRWAAEAAVVRACMVALTEALLSVAPEALVAEWGAIVDEGVRWLSEAAREAADRDTAQLARACVSELASHLRHVMDAQRLAAEEDAGL